MHSDHTLCYKVKRNKHGQHKMFIARLVAGDHRRVHQLDYDKVYAPVVDLIVCVLVLLLALVMEWWTRHVDVKAAFLNGGIDRLLYSMFPYKIPSTNKRKMYRLHKSL